MSDREFAPEGDDGWSLLALNDEPLWSIGEALAFLSPPIPRRTLSRKLAGIEVAGSRPGEHGGPTVRLYRVGDVMQLHAAWCAKRAD